MYLKSYPTIAYLYYVFIAQLIIKYLFLNYVHSFNLLIC